MLIRTTAMAIVLLASGLVAQERPGGAGNESLRRDAARSLVANVPDGFTLATAGDVIQTTPIASSGDSAVRRVGDWLRRADVAFANLEMTMLDIRTFQGYPGPTSDGMRPTGPFDVAGDLKALGVDVVSRANNHALDWDVKGMRTTDRAVDSAGLVRAGSGENLAAARAARFVQTPHGRIGVVALTTTFEFGSAAMASVGEIPGRPGINVLRTTSRTVVDPATMAQVRRLSSMMSGTQAVASSRGPVTLMGNTYIEGATPGPTYTMNQRDSAAILKEIRQGKLTSDFLIVSVHSHQTGQGDAPADFFVDFAHAAIDAGADVVAGHGPHQPRGIEIYKGKPIYYSLGNLFFQAATQNLLASDMYERLGGQPDSVTQAELQQRTVGAVVEARDSYFESVIAFATYRGGAVAEIQLRPIDLNIQGRMANRGIPRAATGAVAQRVLERVARLSAPFGTKLEIRNGIGYIRPPAGR